MGTPPKGDEEAGFSEPKDADGECGPRASFVQGSFTHGAASDLPGRGAADLPGPGTFPAARPASSITAPVREGLPPAELAYREWWVLWR